MTDANQAARPTEGNRVRQAGVKAVKPRDAATLFIIRRDGPKPRVLMGKRHGGHDFMANLWVFPGGRVDKTDFKGPFATDLRPEVAAKFHAHVTPGKARALGLAAIRETFEEAGLLLAKPVEARPALGPWREFLAHGAAPDLEALSLVYRAVTPPMLAKRFDTWFLMADAEHLVSLERQPDCGELEEIAWFDFQEALDLKLPMVTRSVITEVMARLDEPERPIPYMRFRSGPTKPRIL
ncbi:MAG: NUDIX hydrolase [Phenylobacterium sp.]|uniref:NUDIX hydrolase n=1 Tax=Phenylobacterium sp. TaxID=1871053 RepID=UPI0027260AA3|nr:NUDIX hydrolase [Phenylobacterium sp.]MDO8324058.1 NUDIX hydrolase [Phenylobacterium sp.]MDO8911774.1 NUDIX hydrolase [Phenylobacterium sp.]MDO9246317.1 NUDIX hydrolase [Phenylobacterium sp.]MDP2011951.1 NUDIX hydrolase [Phenylobacterium sp.]MDP3099935.1 NUDIX hydrolase [Phenylobacterium sp.]